MVKFLLIILKHIEIVSPQWFEYMPHNGEEGMLVLTYAPSKSINCVTILRKPVIVPCR